MPESVPGPNSLTSRSGKDGSTWLKLLTFESGSQIFLSCSTVRQSIGLSALTTTAMPSLATVICSNLTLFDAQIMASSSLIGREASEMSVSPAQNFLKPPPVPEVPTATVTPLFSPSKPSAAASDRGATVLEPSIWIVPESLVAAGRSELPGWLTESSSLLEHAARTREQPTAAAASRLRLVRESTEGPLS